MSEGIVLDELKCFLIRPEVSDKLMCILFGRKENLFIETDSPFGQETERNRIVHYSIHKS
jgi:hypothetical protein